MRTAKINIVLFSYTLTFSKKENNVTYWYVMEKGSEKSERTRRYEISFAIIKSAMIQIENYINESPCYPSSLLRDQGFDIYLKKELHQPLESVKGRGVIYTLLRLSDEQRRKGVIAISSGSFAYILCYYGNLLDIPVTVVIPTTITNDHIKKCRETGSRTKVVVHGNNMLQAHIFALSIAQQNGLSYIDGNDHPNMIIGQATLGLKIHDELTNIDTVILPTLIDDCGLTAGIATAIKEVNKDITIFEVLPKNSNLFVGNIRSRTTWRNELLIPLTTYRWTIYQSSRENLFDGRYKVTDKAISAAIKILRTERDIIDYHAAIGLAPIADGLLNILKEKRVVIFSFGEVDSVADLLTHISDSSVPRAGPSTSHE